MTDKILEETLGVINSHQSKTVGELITILEKTFRADFVEDVPILNATDALKAYLKKYGEVEF